MYNDSPKRLHTQRLHHNTPQRVQGTPHQSTPQRMAWPDPKGPNSPPRSSVKLDIHSDTEQLEERSLAQLKMLKMKFSPRKKQEETDGEAEMVHDTASEAATPL